MVTPGIRYTTLENCEAARGPVVVIDVLRAFTTACFAFAAGAERILLAGEVEMAFAMRKRFPGALLLGEVDGLPIAGFDYGNSPAALLHQDLHGRTLIQRTSAGVQGMLRSPYGEPLLAASFVCATATARCLQHLAPPAGWESVSFVVTGVLGLRDGDEDAACAEYIAALLAGQQPDPEPYLARVTKSYSGQLFADPARPEFPSQDLELALQLDRFDFALLAGRQNGILELKAWQA